MAQHDYALLTDESIVNTLSECNSKIFEALQSTLSQLYSDLYDAAEIAIIKTMMQTASDELSLLLPNYLTVANQVRLIDNISSAKLSGVESDVTNVTRIINIMTEAMTTHDNSGSPIPRFVFPQEYTIPFLTSNYIIELLRSNLSILMTIGNEATEDKSSQKVPTLYTSSFVEDKLKDYIQILDSDDDSWTKTMKSVKWLSGIRGMKSNIEKVFDVKFDLPDGSPIKEGFDFIKALDMYTKFTDGTYKYFTGQSNGDIETMMQGGTELKKAFKSMMGIKTKGIFDESGEELYGILIDYAINLSDNMEDAFYQYSLGNYSRTQVYEQIFGETFIESTMDTLEPFTTIGADVVYKPISVASRFIGIDLDAEYAKFSDANSGSGRLSDGFDEIEKIVKESGGYFENWKSGMKLIIDKIAN